MSKIVLFFVGLALLVVSGYYFFLVSSPSIVIKKTSRVTVTPAKQETVLPVKNAFAGNTKTPKAQEVPEPAPQTSVQKTVPAVISLSKPVAPEPISEPTPIPQPVPIITPKAEYQNLSLK